MIYGCVLCKLFLFVGVIGCELLDFYFVIGIIDGINLFFVMV